MNVIEIKKRNLELGITPKDWAECLGVKLQNAYNKINGKSHLTLDQANRIQKLLQIEDRDFALYFLKGGSRIS
jgi:plasmid maintenance system antidote protein VapI